MNTHDSLLHPGDMDQPSAPARRRGHKFCAHCRTAAPYRSSVPGSAGCRLGTLEAAVWASVVLSVCPRMARCNLRGGVAGCGFKGLVC